MRWPEGCGAVKLKKGSSLSIYQRIQARGGPRLMFLTVRGGIL